MSLLCSLKFLELNIDNISIETINHQYRTLSVKYHPDHDGGDHFSFIQLIKAKDFLLQYLDTFTKCGTNMSSVDDMYMLDIENKITYKHQYRNRKLGSYYYTYIYDTDPNGILNININSNKVTKKFDKVKYYEEIHILCNTIKNYLEYHFFNIQYVDRNFFSNLNLFYDIGFIINNFLICSSTSNMVWAIYRKDCKLFNIIKVNMSFHDCFIELIKLSNVIQYV